MMDMNDGLRNIRNALLQGAKGLSHELVVAGFDGYIDKLVRLKRYQGEPVRYFETIGEFAGFIAAREKQSSDIEVTAIDERIGGNGPIFALAIAGKGIPCICMAAAGAPKLNEHYAEAAGVCRWVSLAETAQSYAMEFQDGKLMFGDAGSLYGIDWRRIKETVREDELLAWFDESRLFTFANWSGLPHSNDILRGVLEDICPRIQKKERFLFFDLADPSGKSPQQFKEFFMLLGKLRSYYHIILGLNEKEFQIVYHRFFGEKAEQVSEYEMNELLEKMPVDEVVVHVLDCAYAGAGEGRMSRAAGTFVENPKIVTGGGDNFNAGYCVGRLLGLSPAECAQLGNISSMLYVRDGMPASLDDIADYIKMRLEKEDE